MMAETCVDLFLNKKKLIMNEFRKLHIYYRNYQNNRSIPTVSNNNETWKRNMNPVLIHSC